MFDKPVRDYGADDPFTTPIKVVWTSDTLEHIYVSRFKSEAAARETLALTRCDYATGVYSYKGARPAVVTIYSIEDQTPAPVELY